MHKLRPGEVELVNPRIGKAAYELLRCYHITSWTDREGMHVVFSASHLPEIVAAERDERLSRRHAQNVDDAGASH